MDVGRAVKDVLEERERSMRWLARQAGVTAQAMHVKLRKGHNMRVDSLKQIADLLEVDAADLLREAMKHES